MLRHKSSDRFFSKLGPNFGEKVILYQNANILTFTGHISEHGVYPFLAFLKKSNVKAFTSKNPFLAFLKKSNVKAFTSKNR